MPDTQFERPPVPVLQMTLGDGRAVTLREATGEDGRAAIEYLEEIGGESDFLTFGAGEFGKSVAYEVEFFEQMRQSATGLALMAMEDGSGRVLGQLTFMTGARWRMQHSGDFGVSVKQEVWGEGIGRTLVTMLLEWVARHAIVRKVNLMVRVDNTRAIALYERLGFSIEGRLIKAMRMPDGSYHDDYVMGRWIERIDS